MNQATCSNQLIQISHVQTIRLGYKVGDRFQVIGGNSLYYSLHFETVIHSELESERSANGAVGCVVHLMAWSCMFAGFSKQIDLRFNYMEN